MPPRLSRLLHLLCLSVYCIRCRCACRCIRMPPRLSGLLHLLCLPVYCIRCIRCRCACRVRPVRRMSLHLHAAASVASVASPCRRARSGRANPAPAGLAPLETKGERP